MEKISQTEQISYSKYISVFEFHPQYVKKTTMIQLKQGAENFITTSFPTYSSKDKYDVKTSPNIKSYDRKVREKEKC